MAKVLTRNATSGRIEELEVSSGSVSTASATANFGTTSTTNTFVDVPAAWAGSVPVFSVLVSPFSADHGYEDVIVEQIHAVVGEITNGVSIRVYLHAPDSTWGRYTVTVKGM